MEPCIDPATEAQAAGRFLLPIAEAEFAISTVLGELKKARTLRLQHRHPLSKSPAGASAP